jgi:hypothetical protein
MSRGRLGDMPAHVIDEYVRVLDRQLIGPVRVKSDLLAEARHGLEDAAAAYRKDGLDSAAAQARAVAEFGSPAALRPAYQAELAAASARRLAARFAAATLATAAGSTLMWRGAPWTGPRPPAWYLVLSNGLDWLGHGVTGLAVLTVLALGWAARRPAGTPRHLLRGVAVGAYVALGALGLGGLVVWGSSVRLWDGAATWPPILLGGALLVALYAWLARCAAQCSAAARSLPASRPASASGSARR